MLLVSLFLFSVTTVLAGGGKNRGDVGVGEISQNCLNFGECPYGTTDPN